MILAKQIDFLKLKNLLSVDGMFTFEKLFFFRSFNHLSLKFPKPRNKKENFYFIKNKGCVFSLKSFLVKNGVMIMKKLMLIVLLVCSALLIPSLGLGKNIRVFILCWTCPSCGTDNSDAATHCRICGRCK